MASQIAAQQQPPIKNNYVSEGGTSGGIYGYNPTGVQIQRGRSSSKPKQLQPSIQGLKSTEVVNTVSLSNQAKMYQQKPSNAQQSPMHQNYSQPVLSPAPQSAPFFAQPQPSPVSAFEPDHSASFLQNQI